MSCLTVTVTRQLAGKVPQTDKLLTEIKLHLSQLCPSRQRQAVLKTFEPQQVRHAEHPLEAQQAQQSQEAQQALNLKQQAAPRHHLSET